MRVCVRGNIPDLVDGKIFLTRWKRFQNKLHGRDFGEDRVLQVDEQVSRLIAQVRARGRGWSFANVEADLHTHTRAHTGHVTGKPLPMLHWVVSFLVIN